MDEVCLGAMKDDFSTDNGAGVSKCVRRDVDYVAYAAQELVMMDMLGRLDVWTG